MENKDIDYRYWLTINAKHIENSDSYVYNDKIYKDNELIELYKTLKTTQVVIRGFDTEFTLNLKKEWFLTEQEVQDYVSRHIVETSKILSVTHIEN
jgi:hypothetical protein